jgi:2-C-methyl-D-erythritol 4-phosphate cytidylyltransferase
MKKTAVIFGGTSGIGAATASLLTNNNYETLIISRKDINLFDPQSADQILKLLSNINPDVVVNSAGFFGTNTDPHEKIMAVNFGSNWSIIRHYMTNRPTKPVTIIMVGSVCYDSGKKEYMVYAASKAALYSLWQGAKDYFKSDSIVISLINPQRTKTPMTMHRINPDLNYHEAEDVATEILKLVNSDISTSIVTQFKTN